VPRQQVASEFNSGRSYPLSGDWFTPKVLRNKCLLSRGLLILGYASTADGGLLTLVPICAKLAANSSPRAVQTIR
jgi:hypothetical protein